MVAFLGMHLHPGRQVGFAADAVVAVIQAVVADRRRLVLHGLQWRHRVVMLDRVDVLQQRLDVLLEPALLDHVTLELDLEGGIAAWRQQHQLGDPCAIGRAELVDDGRQHISAKRESHQPYPLLAPHGGIFRHQRIELLRRLLRRALAPVVLERVDTEHGNAAIDEGDAQPPVQVRPAAITGIDDGHHVTLAGGWRHADAAYRKHHGDLLEVDPRPRTPDQHDAQQAQSHQAQRYPTPAFHRRTTPESPPEIRLATLVRIIGNAMPPGTAI